MFLDQRRREPIVPGRHRRVGREDDVRGDAARRLRDVDPFRRHAPANQLERGEGAVPFIEVQHTW